MARYYVVLVTVPDGKTGEKLSRLAVGDRLAACVNRIPGVRSRYWWKGKIETASEQLLVLKTDRRRLPGLVRALRAAHPYTVCEVLALPVAAGNPAYLTWIGESLRAARRPRKRGF